MGASVLSGFMDENSSTRYAPLGAKVSTLLLDKPPAPKHFPFPNVPIESNFIFEISMFAFTLICTCLQFMHLYRTVWWLPNSFTNQAVNFYLIDIYLFLFILLILSRRIIYMVGNKIITMLVSSDIQYLVNFTFSIILFVVISLSLIFCAYNMVQNHPYMNLFYLCYPISVYVILFGFKISPLFELTNSGSDNGMVTLHGCSSNPNAIREEVELLKSDFNSRMKQILFSSVINAYFSGFIPCCFAQNYLYYDHQGATQHAIFIFMSCFVAYTTQILPLRYCDVLHRSAMHLGNWLRLESRSVILVDNQWNEDVLWPQGALVRHGRDVYRAQGECNASEPGNSGCSRFYILFRNPSVTIQYLLLLHCFVIVFQLYLLVHKIQWQYIISVTFILFYNYFLLYKTLKNYLVSSNIYREEKILHEKMHVH